MNAATTRSIIAAAGLAAIGLVAWPHQAMPPSAQQAVPTVHRDVALVDDTILGPETTVDTTLTDSVWGPSGSEAELYNSAVSSVGATEAQTLLDTNTAEPVYSGVFNGAESRLFEGVYLDTLASEDQLNQLMGVSAPDSEAAILADIAGGPPLIDGDTLPTVGASGFDADLTSIANDDFTFGLGDLEGYLGSFSGDLGGLSDLGSGLDLTSLLDPGGLDLGSLTDPGSLTDLGSLLTGLL